MGWIRMQLIGWKLPTIKHHIESLIGEPNTSRELLPTITNRQGSIGIVSLPEACS